MAETSSSECASCGKTSVHENSLFQQSIVKTISLPYPHLVMLALMKVPCSPIVQPLSQGPSVHLCSCLPVKSYGNPLEFLWYKNVTCNSCNLGMRALPNIYA